MRPRGYQAIVLACLAICSGAGALYGQVVNGTILGTVRDTSGGVIAMARVSATNVETGVMRTAVSDSTGAYQIVSVPAGNYDLEATNPGFKTSLRRGIAVTVGASVPVT